MKAALPWSAIAFATLLLVQQSAVASIFFEDGFESGDRSRSTNGFVWKNTGDKVFVTPNVAHTGSHSLCFLYSGKPTGSDSTAEQRFLLGGEYADLWIQFFVRFPKNYFHRPDNPSNNKFFVVWSRDYKDPGNLANLHLWSGVDGGSRVSYMVSDKVQRPLRTDGGYPLLVRSPNDLGKWIEITFHWKRQSTETGTDGVLQLWKQVEGEQVETVFSETALSNTWGRDGGSNPAYNFLDQGYLMGWANSGFTADTTICLDDVKFSTTPLIDFTSPKSPAAVEVK